MELGAVVPHEPIEKTQAIRLYGDILFIGPYCIYLAFKNKITKLDKILLILIGASTIYYNARNYLKVKNRLEQIDK